MTRPSITFAKLTPPKKGTVVLLAGEGAALGGTAEACADADALARAFRAADFTGKQGSSLDVMAPQGTNIDRLAVVGAGNPENLGEHEFLKLGGSIAALGRKSTEISVVLEIPGRDLGSSEAAAIAAGILLRSYNFDKYKTRKENGDNGGQPNATRYTLLCADPAAAKKAFADAGAVVDGVFLARDLCNEPANVLGPVEFAERAKELEKLGVSVEILTEKEMRKAGMGAYLGVAQGSPRPPRLVILSWKGGKRDEKPVAFVGKGVVFDTGGNSMKPAASMEDMKGDKGGAAAVAGLMYALAARKAKANVIGILACVENSVDGNAQRPGDIVTSMSGQTIEVMNTDAEGRLILSDALWYCTERFQPKAMIDLATLTGAIMVALGQHYAGLFTNSDDLARQLAEAGQVTQERVWRMPLGPEYDKLIDSKNADMKNVGGRYGGAVTAAQFLQRFVRNTPWAHLDIAGVAMSAPANEINQSWASGFGVRLLDRFVRDSVEP